MSELSLMHRTSRLSCPECGRSIDAATSLTHEHPPEPGDFAVCFYCGHISVFDDNGRLREPARAELIAISSHPALELAQKARRDRMS